MITFILNNELIQTDQPSGLTILDFVRYHKNLRGTKIGCREGDCGACTVLVGELVDGKVRYQSMTSCLMPLANAQGKHIVTVEGINMEQLSPVQQAVVDEGGTQCGFCTVGFIMSLTNFCMEQTTPSYEASIASIDGNICRCTGYKSLERACSKITNQLNSKNVEKPINWLVKHQYLPAYFLDIPTRLASLELVSKTTSNSTTIPVGGGTDLYVQRPEEMVYKEAVYLFSKGDRKEILEKENYIYIGSTATATNLQESPILQSIFPKLKEYIKLVSSTPIRNMGTIAGNLVNASPIGDLAIFFLALNSDIILEKEGKKRITPLRELYLDYKKLDKKEGEIVHSIRFKKPSKNFHFNFEKVCKRTHLDIASVNSAISISIKDGKIAEAHCATGGVGPIPMYLKELSQFLVGKTISSTTIQEAHQILDKTINPISDARGTADYKRLLARQLFYAHFIELFPQQFALEQLVG